MDRYHDLISICYLLLVAKIVVLKLEGDCAYKNTEFLWNQFGQQFQELQLEFRDFENRTVAFKWIPTRVALDINHFYILNTS